jgi:hypothetical protein
MKKIILLVLGVLVLGGGGFFGGDIMNMISGGKDVLLEKAIDGVAAKYGFPPEAKSSLMGIVKNADAGTITSFIKDPSAFLSGKSPQAAELLKGKDGGKLKDLYSTYMKKADSGKK